MNQISFFEYGKPKVAPLSNSLIAYYKLDSSNTDSTGISGNITLINSLGYTTGKLGDAFEFNAATKRGEITSSISNFSFTNGSSDLPFTISLWVYFTGFSSSNNRLVSKRTSGGVAEYHLASDSTSMIFSKGSAASFTNNKTTIANISWSLNTWYHVCITSNGTSEIIYINSVPLSGDTVTTGTYVCMSVTVAQVQIGNFSGLPNTNHQGRIDELGFWKNRELSASEIAYLYNSGAGRTHPF